MTLTAEKLREQWQKDPQRMANQLADILKDFGYPVSGEWVRGTMVKLYAGEKPAGGPAMFLDGWIKKGIG